MQVWVCWVGHAPPRSPHASHLDQRHCLPKSSHCNYTTAHACLYLTWAYACVTDACTIHAYTMALPPIPPTIPKRGEGKGVGRRGTACTQAPSASHCFTRTCSRYARYLRPRVTLLLLAPCAQLRKTKTGRLPAQRRYMHTAVYVHVWHSVCMCACADVRRW